MAASSSDYFKKARRKFSTTVGTGGISGAGTTLPLTAVTGLDTDTGVIVVVDAFDSAGNATPVLEEVIAGVVSGSTLIGCLRGLEGTTAQAHAAGAVVTMYFTESHWDGMVNGMLIGHNQDGTHATNSIETADIQDSAITTAKINNTAVTTAKITDANVTTAKLANNAATYAKMQMTGIPYARLTYTTIGTGGGQVIGTGAEATLAFDNLDSNSTSITKSSNGVLQVADAGVYLCEATISMVDVPNNGSVMQLRTWDGVGATIETPWISVHPFAANNRGGGAMFVKYLPANYQAYCVVANTSASNARYSAWTSNSEAHLTLTRIA